MGQKVHPTGIRLGIVKKHSSTWYAGNKDYADKLNQDLAVRAFINKKLSIFILLKLTLKKVEIKIFPFFEIHFFPMVPLPLV